MNDKDLFLIDGAYNAKLKLAVVSHLGGWNQFVAQANKTALLKAEIGDTGLTVTFKKALEFFTENFSEINQVIKYEAKKTGYRSPEYFIASWDSLKKKNINDNDIINVLVNKSDKEKMAEVMVAIYGFIFELILDNYFTVTNNKGK